MSDNKRIPARAMINCILCSKCGQYATAIGCGICATCVARAERDELAAELELAKLALAKREQEPQTYTVGGSYTEPKSAGYPLAPDYPLAATVERLRVALEECRPILSRQAVAGSYQATNFDERLVVTIAEKHGYGNLMCILSSKWAEKVRGGAFSVGDCIATNAKTVRDIEAALAATPAQNLAKVRADEWKDAARHCEETELLMPVPSPGTTLRQHGANVCMALAAELRAEADRIEAEAER